MLSAKFFREIQRAQGLSDGKREAKEYDPIATKRRRYLQDKALLASARGPLMLKLAIQMPRIASGMVAAQRPCTCPSMYHHASLRHYLVRADHNRKQFLLYISCIGSRRSCRSWTYHCIGRSSPIWCSTRTCRHIAPECHCKVDPDRRLSQQCHGRIDRRKIQRQYDRPIDLGKVLQFMSRKGRYWSCRPVALVLDLRVPYI